MTLYLAGVIVALVRQGRILDRPQCHPAFESHDLLDLTSVTIGAWLTYLVSIDLDLGPVTASALIGLLGGLLLPDQGAAIYCGSFAGMSSAALLANGFEMLVAGILTGTVYVLAKGVLTGFGGKLGTTALVGTTVTGFGLRRIFAPAPMPSGSLAWRILLYAVAGALLTYWLSVPLKHGPVVGSSVVGLLGGLLLPALESEAGTLLAVAVFCASFTGMTSPGRLPSPTWYTVAGFVTGAVFVISLPVLGGAGGKLGTIAFGASLATWALRTLLSGAAVQQFQIKPKQG
jgi:hypothetical protein